MGPTGRTEEEVETIIAEMVRRIVEAFAPVRVILFGSRARGDARSDSDVDLLIVLAEVEDPRGARIAIRQLLTDIPWGKDIIVATPDELAAARSTKSDVLSAALAEGRTLYERGGAA